MGKAMTIDSSLSRIRYIGNGVTTTFSIPFAYLTNNDGSAQLAVYVGDSDTPLVEGEDYTIVGLGQAVAIDDDVEFATYEERFEGGDVVFEVAPEQGVPVAVVRNVPQTQGVVFVEGEKFPAQDFENALDKLTMEVQEVKESLQRAIVFPPTSEEKPIEARDAILLARDEAKTVAEQAQTAADNATSAVEEAEQLVADTKVYIDSAKADIANTVALAKSDIESTKDSTIAVVTSTSASAVATIEQTVVGGKQEINTAIEEAQTSLSDTIAQAVEDVKAEAIDAANEAIQNAADEATQIALNQTVAYVENTAIPNITAVKDSATSDINNTALGAVESITAVKDSAVSELESVLVADKSTLEGYVQVASDSVAISTQRASEAAESARVAGEKVNQIDGVVDEVNAAAASASASAIRSENSAVRAEEAEQRIMESGALPSQAGNEGKFLTTDGTEASWADVGGGLEIGDIGIAPLGIDEAQNKRRYLNGQVISQSQFVSFTNKLKSIIQTYPNLATSETNWQATVTNSKLGQCGKFVIDDELGTIRLPKVVNVQGLADLSLMGSVKAESLPNITGTSAFGASGSATSSYVNSGSIEWDTATSNGITGTGTASGVYRERTNASNSSSAYQDNAPVQQEAIQYPYFIQVATGVEESVDVTREIELNNPFSLLDYKWSEYELNNASWLLSNGAFHSGTVYKSVYELLLKIYNGTETKDGVSVKLSTEAYEDTDFVINTADTTFRLPVKVKLASGNRVAGNGMTLGYTNGTTNYGAGYYFDGTSQTYTLADGTIGTNVGTLQSGTPPLGANTVGITTDPNKSGIETSSSGLKLYFYVGETIQDANVINASGVLARVAELSDEHIVGLGIPDYSAGIAISSFPYTSPSKGFIDAILTNATSTITVNGSVVGSGYSNTAYTSTANILVDSGDVISMGTVNQAYFYPLKGVN